MRTNRRRPFAKRTQAFALYPVQIEATTVVNHPQLRPTLWCGAQLNAQHARARMLQHIGKRLEHHELQMPHGFVIKSVKRKK